MQDITLSLYSVAILIMSVSIHEVAHGLVAYWNGDVTAKYQGRLTLNPVKHFDLVGSFIVPILAYFTTAGQAVFGWAKPVPINPYNLRNQRWGGLAVALAGPASNLIIALVLGIILRVLAASGVLNEALFLMISIPVFTNIVLAIFNLIPVPPFDGFKILSALINLPTETVMFLDRYGFVFILIVVFYIWGWFYPVIDGAFRLITGLS